ncbi:MAG: DUF3794 domain-containing protein [Oscillospiraceae bacterium]|nr:DUF3794 domain-containing protein [Oscillospiraceae bacterium]
MDFQFNKTVIPYLQTLNRQTQNQEQTQELRLTDGMPDIGKVLASWGQILIRGKEWRNGSAGVSGGVMVWVLYTPEEGGEPQCVEAWLPFQCKWDLPDTQRDGSIVVVPMLRSVDARSLSARKLMVRSNIALLGQAMVSGDAEVYSPGELPEDVKVLKKTYPMLLPVEAGEKAFELEETMSPSGNMPEVSRLMRYTVFPNVTDCKIVADKLVMRGIAALKLLYCGVDGLLHNCDFEIPFSQFTQLDSEYGSNTQVQIHMAVTALELELKEDKSFAVKAGLTAQYILMDRPVVEIVEDAYSTNRQLVPQITQLQLPAILDTHRQMLKVEKTTDGNLVRVVDATFYPDPPQMSRENDNAYTNLTGTLQALGYDAEGELNSLISKWEEDWSIGVNEDAAVSVIPQRPSNVQAYSNGNTITMTTDMPIEAQVVGDEGIPMITGLELGDVIQLDPNRPSLILRRVGSDDLWGIAKKTGSTVEAIQSANKLTQEPEENRILLIPIS